MQPRSTVTATSRRTVIVGLVLLAALVLLAHWMAIFTEAINWDEFALLARADRSIRLGRLIGDGRPGLVTLLLVPFVSGCVDSVATVVNARLLWFFITIAYVAGVFGLVRRWFRFGKRPEDGTFEAVAAAALLALMPAFFVWSVQVRTDQVALAAAAWGGLFLMSRGVGSAALAGSLFALSVLCSQKGVYVIALCGVLWATSLWGRLSASNGLQPRQLALEAVTRAACAALAAGAMLSTYAHFVPAARALAGQSALAGSWDVMSWYRALLGYRVYAAEIRLVPLHCVLFLAFAAMTVRAVLARDRSSLALYATCWLTLLLGLAVVQVHGSNFRYFLMTIGLFPAVALGIASGQVVRRLGGIRTPVILLSLLALALGSATPAMRMLNGGQRIQAESMQWINDSGLRDFRGYQVEGALFCSGDPDPLPVMFSQQIARYSNKAPEVFEHLLAEFRRRPVAYMVESYRMNEFPADVRRFWEQHYLPYFGAVYVTGFQIVPGIRDQPLDVLVAGNYRWVPAGRYRDTTLRVGDQIIAPGGVAALHAGQQPANTSRVEARGHLVLAVERPPRSEISTLYDRRQIDSLIGAD